MLVNKYIIVENICIRKSQGSKFCAIKRLAIKHSLHKQPQKNKIKKY